jgi:hypothetical protein
MPESETVTRMNVSVRREIKARMDAASASVNWSSVASQAFEAQLLKLESQREVATMQDVIDRLKAAAEIEENEEYQAGREAGERWAKEDATPKQLQRLEAYVTNNDNNTIGWWEIDSPCWNAPFGALDRFVFAVWTDRHEDRDASDEFWEQALGDGKERINDCDFFHGFGDGAADLWRKVADKL